MLPYLVKTTGRGSRGHRYAPYPAPNLTGHGVLGTSQNHAAPVGGTSSHIGEIASDTVEQPTSATPVPQTQSDRIEIFHPQLGTITIPPPSKERLLRVMENIHNLIHEIDMAYSDLSGCALCGRILNAPYLAICGHVLCALCFRRAFVAHVREQLTELANQSPDAFREQLRMIPLDAQGREALTVTLNNAGLGHTLDTIFRPPCPICHQPLEKPPVLYRALRGDIVDIRELIRTVPQYQSRLSDARASATGHFEGLFLD